jgi:hypothetical protein
MSDPITLTAVAELAALLPPTEQRQLAESILQRLNSGADAPPPARRAWREIRGSVVYPLCGEDAQAWVTRSRQEAEDQRGQQWRGNR